MTPGSARGISWQWSLFGLGAAFALPAIIVIPFNPLAGLALALGVVPAAALALPARRRGRHLIPIVGTVSAVALVLGSLLSLVPPVAVAALFVFGVAAALAARRSRAGSLAMVVALPLTGIGLSFDTVTPALVTAGCMIAGSVYAWGVSLLWAERPEAAAPSHPVPPLRAMAVYGVLLGSAGAVAAAAGFVLDLEHVGWATGAALLVMRPARDQLLLRGFGRALSVLLGALAAALFASLAPWPVVTALVVILVLGSLAGTQGSRWYVTPGFTTFIALTLILQSDGSSPAARFTERLVETVLGVGIALLFGAVLPGVMLWARTRRHETAAPLVQ